MRDSQINGQSMVNKSQDDALLLLRNTKPGSIVQLVVSRQALKQSVADNIAMVCAPSSPKPPMQSTDGMSKHRLTPYKPTIIHDNC